MKRIFALIIYSSTFSTTTGFLLTSTNKQTHRVSFIKNPHAALGKVPRIESRTYSSGDNLQLGGYDVRQVPEKTQIFISYKHDFVNFIKRILAQSALISLLSIMTRRPNIAAATDIAPSPISSESIFDPAALTTTMDALNTLSTASEGESLSLLVTTLSIIRAKQQAVVMSVVAVGTMLALLKCAEVGYAKFVEIHLGYYSMTDRRQANKVQTKGWYDCLYLCLKERVSKMMRKEKEDEQTLHRHSTRASPMRGDGNDYVEEMELKTLDDKAEQYEKAIQESKQVMNAAPSVFDSRQ